MEQLQREENMGNSSQMYGVEICLKGGESHILKRFFKREDHSNLRKTIQLFSQAETSTSGRHRSSSNLAI